MAPSDGPKKTRIQLLMEAREKGLAAKAEYEAQMKADADANANANAKADANANANADTDADAPQQGWPASENDIPCNEVNDQDDSMVNTESAPASASINSTEQMQATSDAEHEAQMQADVDVSQLGLATPDNGIPCDEINDQDDSMVNTESAPAPTSIDSIEQMQENTKVDIVASPAKESDLQTVTTEDNLQLFESAHTSISKPATPPAVEQQPKAIDPEEERLNTSRAEASTYKLVRTSGAGNLCGLNALILSIQHQHPHIPPPSFKELQGAVFMLQLDDTENFLDEQLLMILQFWGNAHKHNLGLGIVCDGSPMGPVIIDSSSNKVGMSVVWIHNDNAVYLVEKDVGPDIAKGLLNHWSGLRLPQPGEAPGSSTLLGISDAVPDFEKSTHDYIWEGSESDSSDVDHMSDQSDENDISAYGEEDHISAHGDEDHPSTHSNKEHASVHGDEDHISAHGNGDHASVHNDEDHASVHNDEDHASVHNDEDHASVHNDKDHVSIHGDEDGHDTKGKAVEKAMDSKPHSDQEFTDWANWDSSKKLDPATLIISGLETEIPQSKKQLMRVANIVMPPTSDPDMLMNEILESLFCQVRRKKGETLEQFRERRENEKAPKYYSHMDALLYQTLGVALPGVYFHPATGEPLIPFSTDFKLRQYFGLRYDRHMPQFQFFVTAKSEGPSQAGADDNQLPVDVVERLPEDPSYEAKQPDQDEEIKVAEEAFGTKDESIVNISRVAVNFEAFKVISYVDLTMTPYSEADAKVLEALPQPIIEYAMERLTDHEGHPILIWIQFNVDLAAKHRIFVGVPPWAKPWAKQVETGGLVMVVDGDDTAILRIQALEALMETYKRAGSPLDQFFRTGPKRRVYTERWVQVDKVIPEGFNYQPRLAYHTLDEYLTRIAVTILSKRAATKAKAASWDDHEFVLRLAELPNAEDRAYKGWIEIPNDPDVTLERPSAGTVLEVMFPSQWDIKPTRTETIKPEIWIARVSRSSPGPLDLIPVTINRPWSGKEMVHSKEKVNLIDTRLANEYNLATIIKRDRGNKVHIHVAPQLKVNKAHFSSLERLAFLEKGEKETGFTQFNKDMQIALPGNNIHKLKPRDIYASVRKEFNGDVTTVMNLNMHQIEAIKAMKDAPGGIAIVQGPCGTGKSSLGIQAATPFFMSAAPQQVLFVTSANTAVTSWANRTEKHINMLRTSGKLKRSGYILRVHPTNAEKSIRDIELNQKGKRDTSKMRPPNIQGDVDLKVMEKVDSIFMESYLRENAPHLTGKYSSIKDKRVLSPDLSLAVKTLEVVGYIQTQDTYPDINRFAQLRANLRRFANNEHESEAVFKAQIKDAMDFTLQNAMALFATTDYAGLHRVIGQVEKNIRVIIWDECPRETEDSMMPFFCNRIDIDGIIMLGDMLQLPPTNTSTVQENVYAKQDDISFMPRMIHLGMGYSELVVQHRMNERLCAMANHLTYDGKLRTHESALYANQPKSIAFANFVSAMIGRPESHVLLDVRSKMDDVQYRERSRYNELYVIVAISMARVLLGLDPTATVAMITPYSAQRDRLLQAAANLKAIEPDLVASPEGNSDRLTATTVDGTQGEEYDYVIDSIISANEGLGFQKDARRGNVATTRARHGYMLITSYKKAKGAGIRDLNFVGRLLNYLKDSRSVVQFPGTSLPPCKFYTPVAMGESSAGQAAAYFTSTLEKHVASTAKPDSNITEAPETNEKAVAHSETVSSQEMTATPPAPAAPATPPAPAAPATPPAPAAPATPPAPAAPAVTPPAANPEPTTANAQDSWGTVATDASAAVQYDNGGWDDTEKYGSSKNW